jgi:adenylate cyclase
MQAFRRYLYRHLHHLLPLPILLAAFFAWLGEPGPFVQFRLNVFDEFLRLKPREYEPAPGRIVDIDDHSLERLGQWPWPRTLLTRLVERLDELGAAAIAFVGAAAIAFDILFIDADRTTPSRVIEGIKEIDRPPAKWSTQSYGFGLKEDRDAEEELQARRGCRQAAAG